MSGTSIDVALRVQAQLAEARKEVQGLKSDMQELGRVGKQASADVASVPAVTPAPAPAAATVPATQTSSSIQQTTSALQDKAAATKAVADAQANQAAAADRAAAAEDRLSAAQATSSAAPDNTAALAAAKTQQAKAAEVVATATDREKAALDRLIASLDPAATEGHRLAGVQNELNAALAKGLVTQEQHTRLMGLAQQRYTGLGVSAGQTAAAMRMLPAQITDVTTSLASGMPVWLVAIQQGGQIKDSFGGIGPAARALVGMLSPAKVAVAGLAVAAGGLAAIMAKGERDAMAYNVAIQTTGNSAGATSGRIQALAEEAAKVSGISKGAAEQAAVAMVQSGRLGIDVIGNLTQSVKGYAAATGATTDAAASNLAKLFTDPAKAAKQLDEQFNFLSGAQRRHIALLVEQGKTEQAQLELSRQTAEHFGRVVPENLGDLQRAWNWVTKAAAGAWDTMMGIGRQKTVAEQLKDQQGTVAGLEELIRQRGDRALGNLPTLLAAAQGQLTELQAKEATDAKAADEKAAATTKDRRVKLLREQFDSEGKAFATGAQQIAKAKKDLDELLAAGPDAGGISQAEYDKRLRSIRERANRGTPKGDTAAEMLMQKIKSDLSVLQASIRDSDALLVKALQEGQASLDDAYNKRLAALREDIAAQRKALESEAGASGTTKARKVEIQAQLKVLGTSLKTAERELADWRRAEQLKLAEMTVRLRVDASALTGQFDRDAIEKQLRSKYAEDIQMTGRISDPAEAEAARGRIDMLISAAAAQAEFNNKLSEAERLQTKLGTVEDALNTQAEKGQISQTEAEGRISLARQAQIPLLQSIIGEMEKIRDTLPPEATAALDEMNAGIEKLRNRMVQATPVVVELGKKLQNTMIDGLADAAANAVANFGSLRDMATSTLRSIAAEIVRSDVKRLLTNLVAPSGGGSSGSSWIGTAFTAASKFFGFAEGGHIRGPGTGTSDSIPALVDGVRPIAVSNNEFIQPERAVQHYGLGFMESVRTLRLPKPAFAFGGLVSASNRARFATGGQVTGGAGAAATVPQVHLQLTSTGTPQKAVSQQASFDGKDLVVKVLLADAASNGQVTRALAVALQRN